MNPSTRRPENEYFLFFKKECKSRSCNKTKSMYWHVRRTQVTERCPSLPEIIIDCVLAIWKKALLFHSKCCSLSKWSPCLAYDWTTELLIIDDNGNLYYNHTPRGKTLHPSEFFVYRLHGCLIIGNVAKRTNHDDPNLVFLLKSYLNFTWRSVQEVTQCWERSGPKGRTFFIDGF